MKHIPQFITGITTFVNGIGLLGTGKKATLPKIEKIRETIKAGGFERALDTGVFKAMEAELLLIEYHESIYSAMSASLSGATPTFVVKASIKQRNKNIPVVVTLKGDFDVDDGDFETGKEAERKIKIFVDYFSYEINGKKEVELDVDNMIGYIFGVDYFEEMRKHLL